MADDDVLHAQIHQHIGADLAGERTGLLKVDILSTHMDVGALGLFHSGDQIGVGGADNDLTGSILDGGDQLVHQLGCLSGGLIHLPVACNDCLTLCLIHSNDLLITKYLPAAFGAASPGRRGRINDISCLPDGELASVGKPERSYYPK